MPRQECTKIVRRFAAALDAENYSAAIELLAECCVYHVDGIIISGREVIIDSYRANSESAKRRFDSVQYTNDVKPTGPSSGVILFTDRLCISNESHEFQCRQYVRIGPGQLIEEITHEELPEERQRLKDFEERLSNRCT